MKIRIYAPAVVIELETDAPVEHPELLRSLHGVGDFDEPFSDFIPDAGDKELTALPVAGGHLRFYFDDKLGRLWAETEYDAERNLTPHETGLLVGYTRGQWSDGIGENFSQSHETFYISPDWEGEMYVEVRE